MIDRIYKFQAPQIMEEDEETTVVSNWREVKEEITSGYYEI